MIAYYGTQLSPHMDETPEGYLICRDVPIARTGEMTYLASELGLEGPDRPVTVYRDPADVFHPDALASFEGKDVTSGHPAESVGPVNHAAYSRGHVQHVRREGSFVVADLLVKDASLISDIKNGVVREMSCGYNCVYTPLPDGRYRQTDIRGNHVAVVPRGRAGHEVAIKDSAATAGKGSKTMSKFTEAILKAFGMAAQEAETPEEVEALLPTAAAALDAEPAGGSTPGQDAATAVPAADSALSGLEGKLDKVISLLEAKDSRPAPAPTGTEGLDKLLKDLEGSEEEKPEDKPLTGDARDAALALLKSVRPAVAAIEDAAVRTQVADALTAAVKAPDTLSAIVQAAERNARKAADAAAKPSFEKICEDQKAAYDARNPHKKKEA